jgi:hypothetical protein
MPRTDNIITQGDELTLMLTNGSPEDFQRIEGSMWSQNLTQELGSSLILMDVGMEDNSWASE